MGIILSIVIPCIPIGLLLWWVAHNKIRPLPLKGIGLRVFLLGGAGGIILFILSLTGLTQIFNSNDFDLYLLFNTIFAAIREEGVKFLAVVLGTKMMKRLKYSIDVILFAVLAALGFAFVETIAYSLNEMNMASIVIRGVNSVAAHVFYTCVIAVFYLEFLKTGNKMQIVKGFLLAVTLHGLDNFCLSLDAESGLYVAYLLIGTPFMTVMFYVVLFRIYKNFKLSFELHREKKAADQGSEY